MFTDPITVNIDGAAHTLARVSQQGRSSVYEKNTGDLQLNISHTNGKRQRSVVQVTASKTAADPLNPTWLRPVNMRAYLVVDMPLTGYTDAEAEDVVNGLADLVQSAGFLPKFLGQES